MKAKMGTNRYYSKL